MENEIVEVKRIFKDPVSGLTHLLGAVLAIAGTVVLIVFAALQHKVWHVVTFSIFGAGMILLYTASTLYHLILASPKANQVLRNIDHSMIYLLIAGTYTPICLIPLRGWIGWTIFGIVWFLAIAGIATSFIPSFLNKVPRWIYTGLYLLMGWISVAVIYPIIKAIGWNFVLWLLYGGAMYSIGAIIYALKKPNFSKWFGFHEIFHLFIIAGTAMHFYAMIKFILPLP